jgi:hypothetical protein
MKNWRPITLLRADYKIVAKAIANRLLGVIAKVTHSDQPCQAGILRKCSFAEGCGFSCQSES